MWLGGNGGPPLRVGWRSSVLRTELRSFPNLIRLPVPERESKTKQE